MKLDIVQEILNTARRLPKLKHIRDDLETRLVEVEDQMDDDIEKLSSLFEKLDVQ